MTKLTLLLILMLCAVGVNAQSYRVQDLSDRLSQRSDELAERVYGDFTNRYSNSRTDVDNLLMAQQLKASADVFRRMVQDRRRNSELRDAASALYDLSRRFPNSSVYLWRDAGRLIDDLARELSAGSGNGGFDPPPTQNVVGRVRWRGTVDNEVHLYIRGSAIEQRNIAGTPFPDGTYNFTSSLPDSRNLQYSVNKIKGRGSVEIIQQPSKDNEWTLVVKIKDGGGGAREYEFEAVWSR
jgi:hypothetical protein